MGEYVTSYLDFDWDHYKLQKWVSCRQPFFNLDVSLIELQIAEGVKFISQVISADSFEAKRSLLMNHDHFPHENAQFYDVIYNYDIPEDINTSPTLNTLTEEEALASVPPAILDHDHGPFAAWHLLHVPFEIRVNIAFNQNDTTRHRDRAYVFWDLERLVKHDMLGRFSDLPRTVVHKHTYTEEQYEEMRESWKIRGMLFLRGIDGYWEKGDENEMAERRRQGERDAEIGWNGVEGLEEV
jgi:hypothetical protein